MAEIGGGLADARIARIRDRLQQKLCAETGALQNVQRAEHAAARQRRHGHGGLCGAAELREIGRDRGATRPLPLPPIRKHLGDAGLHKRSFERKKCAGAGLQEAAVTGQDCEVERRKLRIELPVRIRGRISQSFAESGKAAAHLC